MNEWARVMYAMRERVDALRDNASIIRAQLECCGNDFGERDVLTFSLAAIEQAIENLEGRSGQRPVRKSFLRVMLSFY